MANPNTQNQGTHTKNDPKKARDERDAANRTFTEPNDQGRTSNIDPETEIGREDNMAVDETNAASGRDDGRQQTPGRNTGSSGPKSTGESKDESSDESSSPSKDKSGSCGCG